MLFGCCADPGCYRLAIAKYCGEAHRLRAENCCIFCRDAEKRGESDLCDRCDTTVRNNNSLLVPVPEDNDTYRNIANQFRESWRHPTPRPGVRAIYKIMTNKNVLNKYNAYRFKVDARGRFTLQGLSSGNEQRRWHGTNRRCRIGDKGRTSPCSSVYCSLCLILRSSLDISCAGQKNQWGRFGRGIYTSSASSKANDYSANLVTSSWKALLLVNVVIGNAATYTTNQSYLTQPPWGCDSVIGEPSRTGHLNYDEQVVYTNEAACPAYLVMYRP